MGGEKKHLHLLHDEEEEEEEEEEDHLVDLNRDIVHEDPSDNFHELDPMDHLDQELQDEQNGHMIKTTEKDLDLKAKEELAKQKGKRKGFNIVDSVDESHDYVEDTEEKNQRPNFWEAPSPEESPQVDQAEQG